MRQRIRTVKPDFFHHEGLYDAEVSSGLPLRLAFEGLWTVCDRDGRFEWRPRALKAHILPFDNVDFTEILVALEKNGFISRYESDGVSYGYVPSFSKHQVVNARESASSLPRPPRTRARRVTDACPTRDDPAHGEWEGKGKEGEGEKEQEGNSKALVSLRETDPVTHAAERRIEQQREAADREALVFDYWRVQMGKPRSVLDDKRRARIRARLREASGNVSDLLFAIDGARRDDFLMGRDVRSPRKYDGLETILRDRAQVERLMQLAGANGQPHPILEQAGAA